MNLLTSNTKNNFDRRPLASGVILSYSALFVISFLLFWFQFVVSGAIPGYISNTFIVDGVELAQNLTHIDIHYDSADWEAFLAALRVPPWLNFYPLYYNFFYFFGFGGFFLANSLLLLIGAKIFGVSRFLFLLLLFPFLFITLPFPSKDLMVLVISGGFVIARTRGLYLVCIFLTLLTFGVRDGAAVGFVASFVFLISFRKIGLVKSLISFFFIFSLASFFLDSFKDLFIVQRNMAVYEEFSGSDLKKINPYFGFSVRFLLNLTNAAFRPQVIDMLGGISISSLSLYISGIFILSAFVFACKLTLAGRVRDHCVLAIYWSALYVICLNPLVQPRYLIVMSFVILAYGFSIFTSHARFIRISLLIFIASIFFSGFYFLAGVPFPPKPTVFTVNFTNFQMNLQH